MDYTKYYAKPDKTIKEHNDDLIRELNILKEYGYIKDDKIYELCKKACDFHDIGKANDEFQKRVTAKNKKIKFNHEREIYHNILSAFMIKKDKFQDDEEYKNVLFAVANHHNYVDVCRFINENKQLIDKELNKLQIEVSVRKICRIISSQVNNKRAIMIKGYLHKCDYSASSGSICEYKNNFLKDNLNNFLKGLIKNNVATSWNTMQKYCIDNENENIIVIAQTGMGKSEGALNWIGNNKGYFVLPIRTAINAMYERIKDQIIKDDVHLNEKLAILHSSSQEYYMKNISDIAEKEKFDLNEYEHRGKEWSLPLNITTMDQLFDFVFKYQTYELKLITLAYSKIVIDEIQMYNPELLAYLIFGLEQIYDFGGKIAIFTATLPPFIEELLTEKIQFKPKKKFVDNNIRHNICVIEDKLNSANIIEKYVNNKKNSKSNKILVICNTVKKAQEIYKDLKGKGNVRILHSKFIRKDREILEKEIKEFGKTYSDEVNKVIDNNDGIWISTSLVEASLDIDFDYLYTELQDLSSLFQRLGRCNRKGVKDCSIANCFIYTEIDENILIHGNKGFIDKDLYKLSKEAILKVSGKITERDKIDLIDKYLTKENLKNSNYLIEYNNVYEKLNDIMSYDFEKREVNLRNILSEDVIPSKIYEDNKEEIENIIFQLNGANKDEKLRLKNKIMEYSVSIPKYQISKYLKALNMNRAEFYSPVKINNYLSIRIIDCNYDEMGFYEKGYESQTVEGEFI